MRWLDRLRRSRRPQGVGLLVDGPNMLREEFSVDLATLRDEAFGDNRRGVARLYLDEHASPGLLRAAEAHGYEVIVTSGDVDVKLAIDATTLIHTGEFDVLAIASRDADFKPVFETAGKHGITTLAIAPGELGRSAALVNAADETLLLDGRQV